MSQERLAAWSGVATTPAPFSSGRARPILRIYWLVVLAVALTLGLLGPDLPVETAGAAALISGAALLPAYFWCAGRVGGLPVFPGFAATFLWTYALPLVAGHPIVERYTPGDHLVAGLAVSGFLCLATLLWAWIGRPRAIRPRLLLMLEERRAVPWLIASLGIDAAYWMARAAGWGNLSPGLHSIASAVVIGVTTVASFTLPYLWSEGELKGRATWATVVLFVADTVANLTGLLLINVLSKAAAALVGMLLGRGQRRVLPVALLLAVVIPLHYGKDEMRGRYWRGEYAGQGLTPSDYPRFFAEWYEYSIANLDREQPDPQRETFTERASLLQLFLLARDRQAHGTKALDGAGYVIIPRLLVPRVLDPDKPVSHEGTRLLNIRYGLQRREDTYTTTIGWGLFNEAFGNFGYAGLTGLALTLGSILGLHARSTQGVPVLSVRFLMSVLVLAPVFQSDFSAGVLVAFLFQSVIALGGLLVVLGVQRRIVQ